MTTSVRLRRTLAVALVVAALATPAVAYGAAARVATVTLGITTHYPAQYSYETAVAIVKDASGRPIQGARVTFTWRYKTSTPVEVKYTDSTGRATNRRYISSATVGYKVNVIATASSGGVSKTASNWFIPHRR